MVQTYVLPHFGRQIGMVLRERQPCDAGYSLSDYVQISDFVTKVLIRKSFRQLAGS